MPQIKKKSRFVVHNGKMYYPVMQFVVTHIDEGRNVAVGIITRIIQQNLQAKL